MITRQQLQEIAPRVGMDLGHAEKDYLQHIILSYIYTVSSTEFIFKGGTALQKALKLDRFSEDLDFTFNAQSDPIAMIRAAATKMDTFTETEIGKEQLFDGSISCNIRARGPLLRTNLNNMPSIKIDISRRETVLRPPIATLIHTPYPDVHPYTVWLMHPEEILAEKIRAIITRQKARDVYDTAFLLRKGIAIDASMVAKKLEYYNMTYKSETFTEAIKRKDAIWDRELRLLMTSVPDFKETAGYIESKVTDAIR